MRRSSKRTVVWVVVGLALGILAHPAWATVYDLTNLANGHASLQYHWTMDNDAAGGFYDAQQGGVSLGHARSSTAYEAAMVQGFDASTEAMQTARPTTNRDVGAALRTVSNVTLPSTGTVEYLFKADRQNEGGYVTSGVVGTSRHYFGYDSPTGGVVMGFGDPGQYRDVLGGTSSVAYNTGDWYYVAINYASSGGSTVFNTHVANLSDGDAAATQTITNWSATGTAGGASRFGIGCYSSMGNHYLDGAVDQVAIYSAPLSAGDINARVAAIQAKPDLRVNLDCRSYPDVRDQWVADQSSWNNACVLGNSSYNTAYDPTPSAYGFSFDSSGGGDELNMKRNSSLDVADVGNGADFTVELWAKADILGTEDVLVEARRHTPYGGWMLSTGSADPSTLKLWMRGAGANNDECESNSGALTTGGLIHHLVAVVDTTSFNGTTGSGTVAFYVDGLLAGTDTFTNVGNMDTNAYLLLGHPYHNPTSCSPFDGEIGAFLLHARALTGDEIAATYWAERSGFVPEPTSMILLAGGLLALARRRRKH